MTSDPRPKEEDLTFVCLLPVRQDCLGSVSPWERPVCRQASKDQEARDGDQEHHGGRSVSGEALSDPWVFTALRNFQVPPESPAGTHTQFHGGH